MIDLPTCGTCGRPTLARAECSLCEAFITPESRLKWWRNTAFAYWGMWLSNRYRPRFEYQGRNRWAAPPLNVEIEQRPDGWRWRSTRPEPGEWKTTTRSQLTKILADLCDDFRCRQGTITPPFLEPPYPEHA